MRQNMQLWLVPNKKQPTCRLLPEESCNLDFVECLDGKYSCEVWILAAPDEGTFLELRLNNEVLYSSMRLKERETAEWSQFGSFLVPKGEHRLTFVNHGKNPVNLLGILVTRDGDYIRRGEADRHREMILQGEDLEELLDEQFAVPAEPQEEKEKRLRKLSRMGFLEREGQIASEANCRCGVPMGGAGAGKVELDADGVFTAITVNNNIDAPIYRADGAFMGLWIRDQEESGAWLLQKKSYLTDSIPHVNEIVYRGHFPGVSMEFPELPLDVKVEAFSSLVPNNVKNSSIPGMVVQVCIKNTKSYPVEAAALFSWENLLGTGGVSRNPGNISEEISSHIYNTWNAAYVWCDRTGNYQQTIPGGILFTGGEKGGASSKGEYVLLSSEEEGLSRCCNWDPENGIVRFWETFAGNGELKEDKNSSVDEPMGHSAGALSNKFILEPDETKTITYVLAWHMPYFIDTQGEDVGVYYSRLFGNACETANYLMENQEKLYQKTMEYERLLSRSSLPVWLKEKLVNDRFPIYTCSWFDAEGRFAINEAPTGMMGCLGTMDQRLACCGMYTNLFRELDCNELSLFANMQGDDGSIPHDLGSGSIRRESCRGTWSDLCSSFILQVYRNYVYSADTRFLDEMYPHIKRAVDYQISSDADQNGIPDVGPGKGTTYDTYHWYGSSAFVGILWLAELKAAIKLAVLNNDVEFADKCEKLFERGQEAIIRELWNDKHDFGGYFLNYHDPKTDAQSENCFIAQLAGQWFADLMHLGDLLPKEKIQETLRTIYKRNIDYPGIVLMNDETTPEGDFYGYGYTFMQYDEVYFGCLAIGRGMVKEGLEVFRRVYERTKDSQWNIGLTYYAGGAFNGLPYYMTNPASLFLLEALSGWVPDAVEGVLRFAPHMMDDRTLRLPLFSPAIWVQMEYEKKEEREIYDVEVLKLFDAKFGKLQFEAVKPVREVLLNGESVSFEQKDQKVNCNLRRHLKTGEILHVEII